MNPVDVVIVTRGTNPLPSRLLSDGVMRTIIYGIIIIMTVGVALCLYSLVINWTVWA